MQIPRIQVNHYKPLPGRAHSMRFFKPTSRFLEICDLSELFYMSLICISGLTLIHDCENLMFIVTLVKFPAVVPTLMW